MCASLQRVRTIHRVRRANSRLLVPVALGIVNQGDEISLVPTFWGLLPVASFPNRQRGTLLSGLSAEAS
jgi:hypothetical protein